MNINATFHRAVGELAFKPFKYGENDCALFCNSVYKKAFGMDLAGDIVGTYSDEYHAARVFSKLGGWDGILLPKGFVKVNRNLVRRGDIVISDAAAGIWLGNNKAIFAGGIFRVSFISRGWTFYNGFASLFQG